MGDTPRPPTSGYFEDFLLRALGRAASFEAHSFIHKNLITLETLRLAGIDPDNSPWPREGITPAGIDRKVLIAWQQMHRWGRNLTCGGRRGYWGLTVKGLRRAKELEHQANGKVDKRNLTSQWLGEKLDHTGGMTESPLFKLMAMAVARKCPVSAASQQVEDHISECILRMIRRDSLRDRILAGIKITDSHLCTYAVRSAWTDARDSATNPICRELYGARTETERRRAKETGEELFHPLHDPKLTYNKVEQTFDISVDPTQLEDLAYFEDLWPRVQEEVAKAFPKASETHLQVLGIRIDGGTVSKVMEDLDIDKPQAMSLINRTNRALRRSRNRGVFAACGV